MVQYAKSNNQNINKETEKQKFNIGCSKKLIKSKKKQKRLLKKSKKPKKTKAVVRKKLTKNHQKLKTLLQQQLQLLWIMMHYSKRFFTK